MARIVKPKHKHHSLRMVSGNHRPAELLFVGRGKDSSYIWVGGKPGQDVYTFSGKATLRALAKHILSIVGDEP